MTSNIFNSLMGPLDKKHCNILFYLGIFVLFLAILGFGNGIYFLLNKKTRHIGLATLFNSLFLVLFYYVYRILYNICIKTL